ncbi:hypothetical protein DERF_006569 [Dermatophagoides farinae]|uniref:Uncharacterized protein n=1 Tax=Dermatophagoides farinae TaxID=6954 RepID=A0A922HZA2_DERFA|nr:hypothetical protein DERF_006569 [Dermatophagoides farinae]
MSMLRSNSKLEQLADRIMMNQNGTMNTIMNEFIFKNNIKCPFCHKIGHKVEGCWTKRKIDSNKTELIIFTKSNNKNKKKAAKLLMLKCAEKLSDIWILDSGCTSHTTIDKNLLMDQEDKQIEFELANDVAYGSFSSNLISVRKLIEGGFKINFEENLAQITKNEISFNLWIIDNKLKNIIMNI